MDRRILTRKHRRALRLTALQAVRLFQKIRGKLNLIWGSPAAPPASPRAPLGGARDVEGSVVIITGSTGGVGLAAAKAFCARGASVVVNGRNASSVASATGALEKYAGRVLGVCADVSTASGASRLVRSTLDRFGRVDVLINNAGIADPQGARVWDLPLEDARAVMETNVFGPFLCSRAVIRWAERQNHPVRIINVSSGVTEGGAPRLGAYNMSKRALEGLTASIAADVDDGAGPPVSVVTIRPRSVATALTRAYYGQTEYFQLEEPAVVAECFLHYAFAPVGEIMARTVSEAAFGADRFGETALSNALSALPAYRVQPETFKRESLSPRQERGGAYLHLLQNPYGCYPSVKRFIRDHLDEREIHEYPDPYYPSLRRVVSRLVGMDPACFTFSPGSSLMLEQLFRVFGNPGREIIVTRPTWALVTWPAIFRSRLIPVEVPHRGRIEKKNIQHDLEAILDAITWRTSLIYLVNPCNPTGSVLPPRDLENFLKQVPSHVTVVLDEAYHEYCDPSLRFALHAVIGKTAARVVGLRTFSKFYALSGYRVGYAYSLPEVIDLVDRAAIGFNMSMMSVSAAEVAATDTESQSRVFENNVAGKRFMEAEFHRAGVDFMPSQTSFILFECPLDRDRMRNDLKKRGIFLPNIDNVLRGNQSIVPIGLPEHNEAIMEYLGRY